MAVLGGWLGLQAIAASAQVPATPAHMLVGVLWQTALTAAPAAAPAFDAVRAYTALRDGSLTAVFLESGSIAWSVPQAVSFAPAAAGGRVIGAADRDVWVRDGTTGQLTWQRTLDRPVTAAPIAAGDVIVAVLEGNELIALQLTDGAPRWTHPAGAPLSAPLAAEGGTLFVGAADGSVRAIDAATGHPRWVLPFRGRILVMTPAGDRLIAGGEDNFLYVLDSRTGRLKWKWRTGGDIVGTADMDERRIYYVSKDSVLRAHLRGNGHLVWTHDLATRPVSGPTILDTEIVVAGVSDAVTIYALADGTPAPAVPLPGPAIHRPHLVPAAGAHYAMAVVVTRSGHVTAVGKSVEPLLVPMTEAPGTLLPAEPEPPAIEPPMLAMAELFGSQFPPPAARRGEEPRFVPLAVLLGTAAAAPIRRPGEEPPLVTLGELLGSQHVSDAGLPGVEPPRMPLADLLGRRRPAGYD